MNAPANRIEVLARVIETMDEIAVAVSGGVDSLTLATFIHSRRPQRVAMFHAISPAVPAEATQRVRLLARQQGWQLDVIDAGEFADAHYRANPLNRCFYCKTSLYGAIAPRTRAQIVSGTNLDDLSEFRPGLDAAKNHNVRHPFVEAGIDKAGVRAIARQLGLGKISDLPAAPCLSSRIETGIAIDPLMLALVHQTEKLVGESVQPKTVRCRVRASGVVVELDDDALSGLTEVEHDELSAQVGRLFADAGLAYTISFAPYRVGSAFVSMKTAPDKTGAIPSAAIRRAPIS